MKSKKLLFSTFLLLGGIATFISLSSSSGGVMGASTTGCGGGGCHSASPSIGTSASLTGIPATGFVLGTTYTLTLTVSDSTKIAGGFDLSVSAGAISAAPPNTMVMSGTEIHHTAPKLFSGGNTSWTFNWTAPTSGTLVTISAAVNAVNNTGNSSGDSWKVVTWNFQASTTSLDPNLEKSTFEIYPNPVSDYLHFKSANEFENLSISAISMNGSTSKVNFEKTSNKEYSINTQSLAAGIYILNIQAEGRNYQYSFTKK